MKLIPIVVLSFLLFACGSQSSKKEPSLTLEPIYLGGEFKEYWVRTGSKSVSVNRPQGVRAPSDAYLQLLIDSSGEVFLHKVVSVEGDRNWLKHGVRLATSQRFKPTESNVNRQPIIIDYRTSFRIE